MPIGTTSFGFHCLLIDARGAPPLGNLVGRTKSYGLDSLQICENARPLELSAAGWREVLDRAAAIGLDIQLGCMTLDVATIERYLVRAATPRLDSAEIALAIENHFDIPCTLLAEVAAQCPPALVGFCVDSANSLRNFQSADQVLDWPVPRAIRYHLKDCKVTGGNVGLRVDGAPLGQSGLAVRAILERVLARDPSAAIYLENWVQPSGDRQTDVDADCRWLQQSLDYFRKVAA